LINGEFQMSLESPEARKAHHLFRKEEKVRESAIAWTEYNRREAATLKQLSQLREQRLARGPIVPIVKPRAKPKAKQANHPITDGAAPL
jgi:hypothetical protein